MTICSINPLIVASHSFSFAKNQLCGDSRIRTCSSVNLHSLSIETSLFLIVSPIVVVLIFFITSTHSQQVLTNIPFDCKGRLDGFWRDTRYCDVFHACVAGEQKRSYGCPQVGERFYFDDQTQKCEFASQNAGGCSANQYYGSITGAATVPGSQLSTAGNSRLSLSMAETSNSSFQIRSAFGSMESLRSVARTIYLFEWVKTNVEKLDADSLFIFQTKATDSMPVDGATCSTVASVALPTFFSARPNATGDGSGGRSMELLKLCLRPKRNAPILATRVDAAQVLVAFLWTRQIRCPRVSKKLKRLFNDRPVRIRPIRSDFHLVPSLSQTRILPAVVQIRAVSPRPVSTPVRESVEASMLVPHQAQAEQVKPSLLRLPSIGFVGLGTFTVNSNVNCNNQANNAYLSSPFCNVFHQCIDGTRVDFRCARANNASQDLWWNQETRLCDWPCRVQCNGQIFGSTMTAQQISSESLVFFNNNCRAYPRLFKRNK